MPFLFYQASHYLSIAKTLGAQYTFEKPVNPEELLNAVRELLK
jgi:hypothetical protein